MDVYFITATFGCHSPALRNPSCFSRRICTARQRLIAGMPGECGDMYGIVWICCFWIDRKSVDVNNLVSMDGSLIQVDILLYIYMINSDNLSACQS